MILFKDSKLRKAAIADDAPRVKELLAAGANPEVTDYSGDTVLVDAVLRNSPGAVKELVAHGAKLDGRVRTGGTILHLASEMGLTDIARIFIDARPGLLDSLDGNDATPLHAAIAKGQDATARFLLECKPAFLEAVDRFGNSPLHIAATNGRAECVAMLLEKGASPVARNSANRMPLFLAQKGNHLQVAEILKPLTPAVKFKLAAADGQEADSWEKLSAQRIARVTTDEAIGYRVTEIFNFESRDRLRIVHNLETKADQAETRFFDEFPDKAAIEAARAALLERGGTVPETPIGDKLLKLPRPPGA